MSALLDGWMEGVVGECALALLQLAGLRLKPIGFGLPVRVVCRCEVIDWGQHDRSRRPLCDRSDRPIHGFGPEAPTCSRLSH